MNPKSKKIAIADRPAVLYNEDDATIDFDRPNKDGALSTHCSNHSIQSDDSVVATVDGWFIAEEHRCDSFNKIERVTGHFNRNCFGESNVYVMVENKADEIDENVGLPTAMDNATEGASSNLAASGCSFL